MQGLEPGDHIIAPDDVYWGLRKVIGDVFGKAGLETSYVDMTQPRRSSARRMRPHTRLVWVETPSNPLMKVTDLAAIAEIVRAAGPNAITVCDGTFATPVLQRPLDCGIDMVAHSTTKYISGHSDVVGGALITRHDNYLFERARRAQHYGGAVPSPFDCWLTLRGIDTLPYRVRAHSENAMRIARCLREHPRVEAVHYPGLPDHPGHAIAARQMSGFGGMLSFQVRGGARGGDGGRGALPVVHPRDEPRRAAQPDRASRVRGRSGVADAAESAAGLGRPGASGRSDRGPAAGSRVEGVA